MKEIWKYFLLNLVLLLILILMILYCLFICLDRNISVDMNNIKNLSVSCDEVRTEIHGTSQLSIFLFDDYYFTIDGRYSVWSDGEEYSDVNKINVENGPSYVVVQNIDIDNPIVFTAAETNKEFVGVNISSVVLNPSENYYRMVVKQNKASEAEFYNCKHILIEFGDNLAELETTNGTKTSISSCEIVYRGKPGLDDDSYYKRIGISHRYSGNENYIMMLIPENNTFDMTFMNEQYVYSHGDGTISYISSHNQKERKIVNQSIECLKIENKPRVVNDDFSNMNSDYYETGVGATFRNEGEGTNAFCFAGSVRNAYICGFDIFLSFYEWMQENTGLVATVVLSVIGGALSLTGMLIGKSKNYAE